MCKWIFTKKRSFKSRKLQYLFNHSFWTDKECMKDIKKKEKERKKREKDARKGKSKSCK